MPNLNMFGPYPLDSYSINKNVPENKIGNYALGYISDNGKFIVCYVGRATEQSVNERLKQHIGEMPNKFKMFKYSFANSKKDAYLKECQNFHDFGGEKFLLNDIHPSKIPNDNTVCPVCGK